LPTEPLTQLQTRLEGMLMKILLAGAWALGLSVFLAGSAATAARRPTQRERRLITQAVTAGMEAAQSRAVPSFAGRVTRIKVSVVATPRAFFTRYGVAYYFDPQIGAAAVFLGLRHGYWHVLNYGSSSVGCGLPQRLVGGRRAAILADLGLDCP
jgi:hypothetical protein